jgi:formiminotetrahydrofolate cyclodeaminase
MIPACRTVEPMMSDARTEQDETIARPLDQAFEPAAGDAKERLIHLTLHDFADQVGEPRPGAGGGSVAAYAGTMAAALVDMVCRLTVVSERASGPDDELAPTCAAAETLRARLLAAVDADADAYLGVVAARRLPAETKDEHATREAAITAATRHAAEVPLAGAAACLEVLELAHGLSADFMQAAASELGVAVQAARMCVNAEAVNVAVNLLHLDADPAVEDMRRRAAELERRAEESFAAVWPVLRDMAAGVS